MNVENEESSAESAYLQRLVMRLRDAHKNHQTVFSDDRVNKQLIYEAADTIEHLNTVRIASENSC